MAKARQRLRHNYKFGCGAAGWKSNSGIGLSGIWETFDITHRRGTKEAFVFAGKLRDALSSDTVARH